MLYFNEITTANSDWLVEAREFCSKFRFSFENYFSPFSNLYINESLSLHKARLSFKQYIPSKRNNRYGIKSFIPCDCKSGYVLRFIVYTENKNNEKPLGKSGEIVILLLE